MALFKLVASPLKTMKISFAAAAKLFLSAMILLLPIVGQTQFAFTTKNSFTTITLVLFCVSICMAVKRGFSFVEVVSQRVASTNEGVTEMVLEDRWSGRRFKAKRLLHWILNVGAVLVLHLPTSFVSPLQTGARFVC